MTNEKEKTKSTSDDTTERSKLPTDEEIKRANAAAERLEKATNEARAYGLAEAGLPPQKKVDSDVELAEKFTRGEINLLKDDTK